MTSRTTTQRSAPRARVLAVTSGKGGVGKTFLSANLAAALVRRGERVLVLDADLGLANLDVVLNLKPKVTLHDVFTDKATLDDAMLQCSGGFSVLLAGSGLVEYSRMTAAIRDRLHAVIDTVSSRFDRIILDTGAGISDVVLYTVSLATDVLVVTTPEPTALTDAYATIKVLAAQQQRQTVLLVVNQTSRVGEGRSVRAQLQQVVDRFVDNGSGSSLKVELVGDVPSDAAVRNAVKRRQLLVETMPGCAASIGITAIAEKLAL